MRRVVVLTVAGVAGLATAVLPALGATRDVEASGITFDPRSVTVTVGDSVRWTSPSPGSHTVHFDGEPAGQSIDADGVTRSFANTGSFNYFCDPHQSEGMTGTVVVKAAETATMTTTTSSTQTTETQTQPPTQTTITETAPVPTFDVRATRSSFCTRRSTRCRRPGVVLEVDASTPATLRGTLSRRPLTGSTRARRFGTVALRVREGTQRLRFTRTRQGRTLTPGRYTLSFEGLPPVRFRVTRP